ncbi:ferritin-like domain-containing protein [Flavimarina sp. Hel_I_48]|uniref:ferritin-like domain-containing protein n=1 Tax=Flavimarina sp. Hel_I_48 TaxID=1392488 RepID=UPI0004DF9C3B|nr:PA2169 family four-helix-bundle protein [Flavimarina sp. Hel_I_48]
MKDYTEKIGDHLNDILEKNIDAQKGFNEAVENTDSITLKEYFRTRATERSEFVTEIKAELAHYGEKYKDSGSASASIHRGWMDFKSLFSSDDDESMLEECIRGEKKALKEYDEALEPGEVPTTTSKLLMKQREKIQQGLTKLQSMEDLH